MFITSVAFLIFGPPLLLADLFIGAVLVSGVSAALWLVARGVETAGRVTLVEQRRPGRRTRVQVAYETPGGKFHTEGRVERPLLGDPVPVRYLPVRPAFATTLTRPWRRTLLGIPTVLAVAAASVGMITSAAWYFGGSHTSLQLPLAGASGAGLAALGGAYAAAVQYAVLLRWRRMVTVDGLVERYSDNSPVGPGILISFETADGDEEDKEEQFWARAGTVLADIGDTVTVHYDPARPATSATVQSAENARALAIAGTVFALGCGALTVFSLAIL